MKFFSDKVRIDFATIYLIASITNIGFAVSENFIFQAIIPKPNRCWYLYNNESELASVFLKTSSYPMVILNEYELLKQNNTSECDGYILILENWKYIATQFRTLNEKCEVNTKMILIYEADVHVDITNFVILNNITLNFLLLQVLSKKIDSNLKVEVDEILEVEVFAPLSGRSMMYKANATPENVDLTELFKSQEWKQAERNATLEVAMIEYSPYNFKTEDGHYDGFEYRIINGTMKNVSWTFFPLVLDSPNIEAAFESLNSGKADIGLVFSCMHDIPLENLGVLLFYESACRTMLVPKPRPLDPATYLYLSLDASTWLAFLATFLITCLFIYAIANIKERQFQETRLSTHYQEMMFCFISLCDVVCGHGIFFPKVAILKVILLLWMVVSMMVTTSFSTGYSSFLTEQKFTSRITTLEQMVDAGIYWAETAIPELNAFARDIFNSSFRPYLNVFASRSQPWPAKGWEEVVHRVQKGESAMMNAILNQEYLSDTLLLNNTDFSDFLEILEDCVENCFLVLPISPRTPFRHILKSRLSAAVESGLVGHWIQKVMRNEKYSWLDKKIRKQYPTSLSVSNVRGALLFMLIGWLLSSLFFILELFSPIILANRRITA